MSNNEETGPSDQDADEMDYEGEQEYLDYLTAKQGLQVGLDDGTDADIDTDGAGTDGGAETGGEGTGGEGTGADAATEKRKHKKQRIRKPNKLGIGRLVITKMAPGKFEPLEPEEPRKCYGNQVGCILRECASINDDDLRSKEHLTQLLLTKLHKRFKFPDRDDNIEQPWDDPKMKKINNHAMGMFSNDLASWKGRVKRAIEADEPLSKILEENPTLTEEEFEKFKDTCATEAAKAKAAKFKSLQQRNTGKHRLGSRGYLGKRPIWDKEDAEREAAGLPDPFAKFTNPLERDFIRARYKWDKEKRFFTRTRSRGN